jgi:putative FmdB family regulatory protein
MVDMPHYDYTCADCGYAQEVFQKISDPPLNQCPKCFQTSFIRGPGGGIGLQFHGEGFYINDYPNDKSSTSKNSETPKAQKGCACGKPACDA